MSELSEALTTYREASKRLASLVAEKFPPGCLVLAWVRGSPILGRAMRLDGIPDEIAIQTGFRELQTVGVDEAIAVNCPGDTNGDGDCELCHDKGGCPLKRG